MENDVQQYCCSTIASSELEKSDEMTSVISLAEPLPGSYKDDSAVTSASEVTQADSSLLGENHHLDNSKVPSEERDFITMEYDSLTQLIPETSVAHSVDDDSHHTIMSACSTVGQHIRQNITETLNLRDSETPEASSDVASLLQAAVIEKLENFENSVMEKLSETVAQTFDKEGFQAEINNETNLLYDETNTTEKYTADGSMNCNVEESNKGFKKALSPKHGEEDLNVPSSFEEAQISALPNNSEEPSADFVSSLTENVINDPNKCTTGTSDNSSSLNSVKTVCSIFGQRIHETLAETLNSGIVESSILPASSSNIASLLEVAVVQKLENFENSIMEKLSAIIHRAAVQNEVEETSSLSGEADTMEKDAVEDSNSEKFSCNSVQNESDNKISCLTDGAVIKEKSKKSQRSSANKKKGEKTIGFFTNQILKSLSSCATEEEKLSALCRKHAETLDKLKSTEIRLKQNERQVVQISREKEQLQAEHNRNVLAKSRLESLCRELQRQNKAVKEESLLRIREEEEKRKEVASKFQATLNEISSLMQENSKKNLQLKEENAELAQKLKTLVEHYEMWEKHMEKVVQQKDLEAQLAKAKHAKTNLQLKQETESFLREKQTLLENMSELQKKCTQLASNELQLRAELSDYTSKYEEFQTVLSKSNQVFASFKTDMDTTSKKIKKLEKETNIWKQKWENSNNALLEMIADKQERDKELKNAQQRILTLEKLCRALQAERNDLRHQVKEKGVEENCNTNCEDETQAC